MSACVPLRQDFSADDLRRLAQGSQDAAQSRRLLALATIYDDASRMDPARGKPLQAAFRADSAGMNTARI